MRTSVTALLLLSTATLLPWSHGWSLFGAPASGNGLSLHPDSPAEADPISVRAKRQAYQVYVGGDASVSINKGGEAESGPWGPWTTERECSRTCGGGVLIEKRTCSGECTGPSVRYVSCNIEACESTTDFRAEQCAKNNDSPLHGVYYKWLPHVGKNKCELTCKPESGTFYYKWADKVVDGTRCDSIANDICVDGVCLPLGCDGKLGSSQKNDKCGVCGGDGSTCTTVEGIFDERNLSPGYHNVIVLPVGATNIRIEETRSTANHLAIKNSSDYFYLNGDHQIVVGDTNVDIAGTRFKYEAQKTGASERLTAAGPLTEEITVAILYDRTGGSNSAIEYEFSVPIEQDVPYLYKPGEWSQCSVTCGKGVQTRTPYCIDTLTQQRVEDNLCDEANSTKPDVEKDCVTVDCEAEWFEGDWEQCSESCGDLGLQYRVVYCHKVFSDGRRMTVDDANCTADRPEVKQSCNRFHCPEWHAGPWSACSEKCGDAKQYRSVTCRSEKIGEEGKLLPADQCNATLRFEPDRDCNLGPCEGLKFITTDWKLCEKCNDTEETRNVTCVDKTNRVYPIEKCLNENATEVPIDVRSCATVQPCVYEWHASEWSKCSTECGHGHKTRRVNCAIAELGQITVVDESLCQGEKPELKTNCTNEEKCTGTWFASPWSNCTAECAGGEQSRLVVCLNYDHEPVPEWCDEATKPAVDQECNVDPCPTCFDGEFGCCPDNITYALGEWSEGCSNCSLAEFGCCADNITEATGPNALGCLEYVEPEEIETTTLPEEVELIKSAKSSDANETDEAEVEGSGEDVKLIGAALQAGVDEEDEACNITVTSEDGKTAQVACALNTTLEENDEFLSNATEPENVTIHCSKTEFGCCPDWYTAAEGPDAAGCPEIELGACNDTLYGCCLDNVTLARGPNLEGCGDPACAASRFGCCKDRKTIGFGPHYLGCERSSFPCEISEFGCCPDGETAALGKNGTGCGANCLVTKYGCCPDGVTVAKGLQNEGCGCQFGQFGCCPDGKTPAKGASNYGCPNTCAQSQFGCCPDGKTPARGTNKEGCPCQYTRYGCCPDGETTALGPNSDGCDDCRYAKYGCCPDGESKALGPDYSGCPSTTVAPFLLGGTVAPAKILACSLPQDIGKVCNSGYKLQWFYDTTQGRCNQFWYGGCGGNDNRYATKEMCETICIEPPSTGRCYLPKIEGPPSCTDLVARYYYNHETKQCIAFWWRKCVQNANNFETFGECTAACQNADPITTTIAPVEIAYHVPTPGAAAPAAPAQPVVHSPQDSQAQPQVQVQDAGAGAPQVAGPVDPYAHLRNPQSADPYAHLRNQQQQPQQQQPQTAPVQTQPTTLVTRPQTSDPRAVCSLKKDVGRCTGHFPAFYYEVESASCKQFEYSGCGGNRNLFHTKEQCEDVCVARPQTASPVHHLPIRIGLAGAGRVGPALAGTSACDLPKDPGPCQNYTSQWYYNKADGTCNRFHYGGCEGNENRFGSSQHCIVTCGEHIDACELPPVEGPCNGNQLRYYYNREAGECQTFTYKGCLGNNNRFVTIEECQKRCKPFGGVAAFSAPLTLAEPLHAAEEEEDTGIIKNRCEHPVEVGYCRATIIAYFFNTTSKRCEAFDYGGCGGSDNRFDSYNECDAYCGRRARKQMLQALNLPVHQRVYEELVDTNAAYVDQEGIFEEAEYEAIDTAEEDDRQHLASGIPFDAGEEDVGFYPQVPSALPELCFLGEDRGSCYGEELAWRYDSDAKDCVSFLYTGCKHNANYFTSFESCQRACGRYRKEDVCRQPKESGNCSQRISRWFYDESSGDCRLFLWSGCGGNGNRFSAKSECQHLCHVEIKVPASGADVCKLERDVGPCLDAVTQWYYDHKDSECRKFTYGGCRGNGNRFNSRSECEAQCRPRKEDMKLHHEFTCSLSPETGPCQGSEIAWFFDPSDEQCRTFTYSGCQGNDNRFQSEAQCFAACRPHRRTIDNTTVPMRPPKLVFATRGPFLENTKVEMKCVAEAGDKSEFAWYKNNIGLDLYNLTSSAFSLSGDQSMLTFNSIKHKDSGLYSCAAGKLGILSDAVRVEVKAPPQDEFCVDKGTQQTCLLINRSGLCSNSRFGGFCCATCTKKA